MKNIATRLFIFSTLILLSLNLSAQDYKLSAGARLGTYFAGSAKAFIGQKSAVEGIVGISREAGQSILALGGFFQRHHQLTSDIPTLRWYYGAGVFVGLGSGELKTSVSFTGNIGLEYTMEDTPINFFIDGIPYINVTNNSKFDTEASIGIRYIFSRATK